MYKFNQVTYPGSETVRVLVFAFLKLGQHQGEIFA